ncbi:MAG: 7-cyano-7-deazaguanine synthase QueC [Thermoplasmata archaeon]|nr:7-cyano-7-deazaguanine synthase QueC [Thermoplasmata archaeon]
MKAVALLSGGLDSTTSLAIAISLGYDVFPITFIYGQRHKKEIESAKKIAKYYKLKLKIIKVELNKIGGSALTDDYDVPSKENYNEIGDEIPITYVPARNTVFLSIALSYAEKIGAEKIFIGVNALDYSGYPDCRPEYIDEFNKLSRLATKVGVEGKPIEVVAPLLHMTKGEIIKKGLELNVPYELTWSCYNGREKACGACDSCLLRLKGFMEANAFDPIEYEKYPDFYKKYLDDKK